MHGTIFLTKFLTKLGKGWGDCDSVCRVANFQAVCKSRVFDCPLCNVVPCLSVTLSAFHVWLM
uniref:Uncharacterized protein n=1 Tax=Anguilla anguilla TaxID=7936 RepID=A0A0E9WGT1_ANGAN